MGPTSLFQFLLEVSCLLGTFCNHRCSYSSSALVRSAPRGTCCLSTVSTKQPLMQRKGCLFPTKGHTLFYIFKNPCWAIFIIILCLNRASPWPMRHRCVRCVTVATGMRFSWLKDTPVMALSESSMCGWSRSSPSVPGVWLCSWRAEINVHDPSVGFFVVQMGDDWVPAGGYNIPSLLSSELDVISTIFCRLVCLSFFFFPTERGLLSLLFLSFIWPLAGRSPPGAAQGVLLVKRSFTLPLLSWGRAPGFLIVTNAI